MYVANLVIRLELEKNEHMWFRIYSLVIFLVHWICYMLYFYLTHLRSARLLAKCDHGHILLTNDDVIKWKLFPSHWPLCREVTAERWIPCTKVTHIFDAFFYLRLDKCLSKQWWGWWFETLSRPLWRHCNAILTAMDKQFHPSFIFGM